MFNFADGFFAFDVREYVYSCYPLIRSRAKFLALSAFGEILTKPR
jgi:hypothetical protein